MNNLFKHLNEDDWKKNYLYEDGLTNVNLEKLRKFTSKKKEFND